LQLLGCPIANDSCYGGELFYGTDKLHTACEALARLEAMGLQPLTSIPEALKAAYAEYTSPVSAATPDPAATATASATAGMVADADAADPQATEPAERVLRRACRYCQLEGGPAGLELQRSLHCDGVWLHALRYQCQDEWAFTTELPQWAGQEVFSGVEHPFRREKEHEMEVFRDIQARLGAG